MAPQQVIATVASVKGKAFACDENGRARPVKAGDPLLEGEKIVTKPGGSVVLVPEDGAPFAVPSDQSITMTSDVGGPCDQTEVAMTPDKLADAIAALQPGKNFDLDNLEPPSLGPSGGGGGGHSFVRLLRIVEAVDPMAFGYQAETSTFFSQVTGAGEGGHSTRGSDPDPEPLTPDEYHIVEGTAVPVGNVLSNDGLPAGTEVTRVRDANGVEHDVGEKFQTPLGGWVTVLADGTVLYEAPVRDHGQNGHVDTDGEDTDHIQYIAGSGADASDWTTVDIVIDDTVPVAEKNHYEAVAGETLNIPEGFGQGYNERGLLTNDSQSADGGAHVAQVRVGGVVYDVTVGTPFVTLGGAEVTINPNGSLSYLAPVDFVGSTDEGFDYRLQDADGSYSEWASVTFDVASAPIDTTPDDFNILEGLAAPVGNVLINDLNLPAGAEVVKVKDADGVEHNVGEKFQTPLGGWVTIQADGTLLYEAPVRDHGLNGHVDTDGEDIDHIQYVVATDSGRTSDWTTVNITIDDTVPVAEKNHYEAVAGETLNIPEGFGQGYNERGLLTNDSQSADGGAHVAQVRVGGVVYDVTIGTPFVTLGGAEVTINPEGSLSYLAPVGFVGDTDEGFDYRLQDADGSYSEWASVTFDVAAAPIPDTTTDDFNILEGLAAPVGNVLVNDGLPAGAEVVKVRDVNGVEHDVGERFETPLGGWVTIQADGTLLYEAPVRDHGLNGHVDTDGEDIDHIQYIAATDGGRASDWTTVNITIDDTVPVAEKNHYEAVAGETLNIPADFVPGAGYNERGLLTNDRESADGGAHVAQVRVGGVVYDVTIGTPFVTLGGAEVTINPEGSLSYLAPLGFVGDTDEGFDYRLQDADGSYSEWASVTFDVKAGDLPPPPIGAADDCFNILEGTAHEVGNVLANDILPAGAEVTRVRDSAGVEHNVGEKFQTPLGGWVTIKADGTVLYEAPVRDHGLNGHVDTDGEDIDHIQYIAGADTDRWTTVNITIDDTVPVAEKNHYEAVAGEALEIPAGFGQGYNERGLLTNDSESADGGAYVAQVRVGGVAYDVTVGTPIITLGGAEVTINPNGSLSYLAPVGFVGDTDEGFDYRLQDADGSYGNWESVTFDVKAGVQPPPPPLPIGAADDSFNILEGATATVGNVLANDGLPPDTVVIRVRDSAGVEHNVGERFETPLNGWATVAANGDLSYEAPVRDHGLNGHVDTDGEDIDHIQYIAANSTGETGWTTANVTIDDTVPGIEKNHYDAQAGEVLHVPAGIVPAMGDNGRGLLTNDRDSLDGGLHVAQVRVDGVVYEVTPGTHFTTLGGAEVTIDPEGNLDYFAPLGSPVTDDGFEYRVQDADGSYSKVWEQVTFNVEPSPADDQIIGGSSHLTLTGGAGADVFEWHLADISANAPVTNTITDFNLAEGDRLDLRDLLSDDSTGDFLHDASHLSVTAEGGNTTIAVTPVGAAEAQLNIVLNGVDLTDGVSGGQDGIINHLLDNGTLVNDN
jgi:hypothetical protein